METGPATTIGRAAVRASVLLLGAALVFVVVLGLGRLMLPQAPISAGTDGELALPVLTDIQGVAAVLVARGDVEGRYEMLELASSKLEDDGEFSLTFRSGSNNRLLISGQGGAGEPINGLDVWLVLDGVDYTDREADCTAQLVELEATVPTPQGNFWWTGPRGSGTLSCEGLNALRSDRHTSIEGAFRFDQIICFFSCR
jgi:hypothetical protein